MFQADLDVGCLFAAWRRGGKPAAETLFAKIVARHQRERTPGWIGLAISGHFLQLLRANGIDPHRRTA